MIILDHSYFQPAMCFLKARCYTHVSFLCSAPSPPCRASDGSGNSISSHPQFVQSASHSTTGLIHLTQGQMTILAMSELREICLNPPPALSELTPCKHRFAFPQVCHVTGDKPSLYLLTRPVVPDGHFGALSTVNYNTFRSHTVIPVSR